MNTVFISYQHDEKEQVRKIVTVLETVTGAKVWVDWEKVFVGDQFAAMIESAIQDSDFFVIMVSRKWFSSDYCNMEFSVASLLKKKIVPIYLEDCEVPMGQGYALALSRVHHIKAYEVTDEELARSFRYSELVDRFQRGVELYMEGRFREAVEFFSIAAEKENSKEAMYDLGLCYMLGNGIGKDREEGVRWIRKAAGTDEAGPGLPQAQRDMGKCYEFGEGVDPDEAEAFRWYMKAAQDSRDMWAMYHVARCYDEGTGVDVDKEKAFSWYRRAADLGHTPALYRVARCYDFGNGVAKDQKEATRLYRIAADRGLPDAVNAYGVQLFFGEGIDPNREEAVKYYRLAAEQGSTKAQYNLATSYDHGNGIKADPVEAFIWYCRAAEGGDPDAQFCVGIRYYLGKGVMKDQALGLAWLRKAEQNGNTQAERFLKRLRNQ